ncbi:MAG: HAD-IB family phosphatase [Saprospiraceae bacterium]|nr:HAD-IB family phosphatase [Saprospiraceae bacterium]
MSGDNSAYDFFIAHAGANKISAEELYEMLILKAKVFLDSKNLILGDDWDLELSRAQKNSKVTVVLVSSETEQAYYQREEIAAAIDMARLENSLHRVVPIYLDKSAEQTTPYGLRLKHGLHIGDDFSLLDTAQALVTLLDKLAQNVTRPGDFMNEIGNPGKKQHMGIIHLPSADWQSPVRKNVYRYKLAVFDLDGTLVRGEDFDFSWEAIWRYLGFARNIQNRLKREYRRSSGDGSNSLVRIKAYQHWCQEACRNFINRGLNRIQLKEICSGLSLTNNCREALSDLRSKGVVIAIVSGGIHTFLEDLFPDYNEYVDFVFINELLFAPDGSLTGVIPSHYDFQGKADALDLICEKVGCSPQESVFVGDHFNDEYIMLKADKAIAYPPKDEVVQGVLHVEIEEDDLLKVVSHILMQ